MVAPSEPVTPTFPLNCDPLIVATTESFMFSVTAPEFPPPVRPVPALTPVMSPARHAIVTYPLEDEVKDTLIPASL